MKVGVLRGWRVEDMLDRRTFLRGMLKGAVIGAVATPALAELLTPKRTVFLPPAGGWWGNTVGSSRTPQEIYSDIERMFSKLQEQGWDGNATFRAGPNAGVPQFLTNYMDPKLIEVIVAPMTADQKRRMSPKITAWYQPGYFQHDRR